MVSSFDIDALRSDTKAIIAVNPYDIAIVRNEVTIDEYGNTKRYDATLDVQQVRIAELSHSETERLMLSGLSKNHTVNITALHDADIQKDDVFMFQGNKYRILFMRSISLGGYGADCVYKKSGRAEEITEE